MTEENRRAILEGQRVTRVCFDHTVTLLTEGGYELRLETPFSLTLADGSTLVDPQDTSTVAGVLSLLHATIKAAEYDSSGRLAIALVEGVQVVASAHPSYEAWVITGPAGEGIVCLPGGGVSEWSGG